MNQISTLFVKIILALFAFTTPAFSGPPDADAILKLSPCKADIGKLCAVVKPGEGRIQQCLAEKSAQLSDACRKHRDSHEAVSKELREACRADVKSLCSDTRPGRGRFMKCLKEKEAQTSASCKEALKKIPAKK